MSLLAEAKELRNEIVQVRRQLHKNPELSFREVQTSSLVVRLLKEAGIEVSEGVAGTGVVGILQGEEQGNTLAIRADMDALPLEEVTGLPFASRHPGVMHACGHDLHTAVLLGAAKLLSKHRASLKGTLKFIFQPGEEVLTGAAKMIEAGVLENPAVDAILSLHCWPALPAGTIGSRNGALLSAADTIKIVVEGKPGHAAHPHKCVDPIVIAGQIITALQTIITRELDPLEPVVITIGKISGGTAHNIIASHVVMTGTVRTIHPATRAKMPDIINRIVKKIAEGMNGKAEIDYAFGPPPVLNDPEMVELLSEAVKGTLGEGKYVELLHPSLGSEDFAFYLEKVQGMMFRLGTSSKNPNSKLALHNPGIIFDEDSMVTGIAVLSEFAIKYLQK